MKRTTLRAAGISVLAAVALGTAVPAASAATTAPAQKAAVQTAASTTPAASLAQQAEARHAARVLLDGPLAASLTDAERTEITKVANGESAAANRWSLIRTALSKISGFGKAIAGNFNTFKAWWDGLAWWQKLPITAIEPTITAWTIWEALH
ncbi:hypothetical protein ACIPRL_35985 [Streptomyces sp. NPDC090085]|uniref:hypothetical protein n=1 Tax=Streptomyces sp. NPDC090085 TaxID=3365943 RepID=UPI00382302D4